MTGARETRKNSKVGHRHDLLTLSKVSLKLPLFFFFKSFHIYWIPGLQRQFPFQIWSYSIPRNGKTAHIIYMAIYMLSCTCTYISYIIEISLMSAKKIAKLENSGNLSACTECQAKYQEPHSIHTVSESLWTPSVCVWMKRQEGKMKT